METPLQEAQRALAPPKSFAGTWVAADRPHVWADKEFHFGDLVDIVNPLQHLPVVSTIYRALTGDTIGNVPRVLGDTLFGGPIGLVSGLIGMVTKEETGKDIGEHVLALATGGDPSPPAAVAAAPDGGDAAPPVAEAVPPAPPLPASPAPAPATPQAAPTIPSPPAAAAVPDHAPMPLSRAVGGSAGMAAAAQGAALDPRQAFLAQGPAVRRMAGAEAAPARQLSNHVVPLQTNLPARPAAPAAYAATAHAATIADAPVDISQRMLSALDKYMRLQQEKNGTGAAPRGDRLDVSE